MELNTRQRFVNTLTGQETDRVPFMRIFGGSNYALPTWTRKRPWLSSNIDSFLGFEGRYRGWDIVPANFSFNTSMTGKLIEERDQYDLYQNQIGEIKYVNKEKNQDFHSYVYKYALENENDWDRIRPYVVGNVKARLPNNLDDLVELYKNRNFPLQLTCGGVYGFIRNLAGDENLCYLFYDNPSLVKTIIGEYMEELFKLWEILCQKIDFDLIESWEDMAYKGGSIISPEFFYEFLAPHFKNMRKFADAHNIPLVMVDSDGYTDLLAQWLFDSGVNALYPFEVGAACNPKEVRKNLPFLGGIGGLDKGSMAYDKKAMDMELEKAQELIKLGRFIPGPDHMVLANVPFENYEYFMKQLKSIILTTKIG